MDFSRVPFEVENKEASFILHLAVVGSTSNICRALRKHSKLGFVSVIGSNVFNNEGYAQMGRRRGPSLSL